MMLIIRSGISSLFPPGIFCLSKSFLIVQGLVCTVPFQLCFAPCPNRLQLSFNFYSPREVVWWSVQSSGRPALGAYCGSPVQSLYQATIMSLSLIYKIGMMMTATDLLWGVYNSCKVLNLEPHAPSSNWSCCAYYILFPNCFLNLSCLPPSTGF